MEVAQNGIQVVTNEQVNLTVLQMNNITTIWCWARKN